MKINPKFGEKIIALPSAQVIENLASADEAQIKILIYALSEQNSTLDELASATGYAKDVVKDALLFWKEKGAIGVTGLKFAGKKSAPEAKSAPPKEKPDKEETERKIIFTDHLPRYTEEEVAKKLKKTPALCALIDDCSQILSRILNPTEAGDIVVLYDYLHLREDYIMLLCSHCAANGKTSLQYIRKAATNLFNEGVATYAELERYYENLEKRNTLCDKYRDLFGLTRSLTSAEVKYITAWTEWGLTNDLLVKAFEVTVAGAAKPSIKYMNAVLESWHNEGIDTPEKADKAREEFKKENPYTKTKKKSGQGITGSFDTGDFFEAALQRSYSDKDGGTK